MQLFSFLVAMLKALALLFFKQMYKMIKMRVALTTVDIWTSGNQISVDGDASETLRNFVLFRDTNIELNSSLIQDHSAFMT